MSFASFHSPVPAGKLSGLDRFGRDWSSIVQVIGTRSVAQVRTVKLDLSVPHTSWRVLSFCTPFTGQKSRSEILSEASAPRQGRRSSSPQAKAQVDPSISSAAAETGSARRLRQQSQFALKSIWEHMPRQQLCRCEQQECHVSSAHLAMYSATC